MDLAAIAKLSTSIAETGNRQEVQVAVLKRALNMQGAVATQMIDAITSVPSVPNLPPHLGNKVNTTA